MQKFSYLETYLISTQTNYTVFSASNFPYFHSFVYDLLLSSFNLVVSNTQQDDNDGDQNNGTDDSSNNGGQINTITVINSGGEG